MGILEGDSSIHSACELLPWLPHTPPSFSGQLCKHSLSPTQIAIRNIFPLLYIFFSWNLRHYLSVLWLDFRYVRMNTSSSRTWPLALFVSILSTFKIENFHSPSYQIWNVIMYFLKHTILRILKMCFSVELYIVGNVENLVCFKPSFT